jgi:hypothetical protein
MPVFSFAVTTTGAAGSATGSKATHVFEPGTLIDCIKVDYHASAPGTTDLTIVEATGLTRTVLSLANANTDAELYPRHGTHTNLGVSGSGEAMYIVEGALTIALAGCDALTNAAIVHIQTFKNPEAA